ncbi:MAG: ribonuclease III domain-containing protein [Clostridia bacterium]|nr:ribonuclease III domain-containing protein [Clostridia bacterium]
MDNVNLLSPSVLAFVGDAVYGLLVRTRLAEINRSSGDLHALSVKYVSATAQAEAFSLIEGELSEKELSIFRRGRNFHTGNTPKSATGGQYHTATGLECLFGFFHLSGQTDREKQLFEIIWKNQTV